VHTLSRIEQVCPHYFGTGETFLFAIEPRPDVFRWSGRSAFFLLCKGDSLAIGGGGHYGIRIDSDMCTGSSGWCATFNSPQLSAMEDFECVHAEWWGFSGGFAEDGTHSPIASLPMGRL
jgi:hypothetical protein